MLAESQIFTALAISLVPAILAFRLGVELYKF
uniref:Photosystem I reaction center subunit XII n=1 Tax=Cyanophora biloba TaxID=1489483 RepID=A0A2Z4HGP9_9EUKA|nr:photosystem I subunit M [Cyanophora biloba]AWW13902.1 photosystem I subunit M [Cyanophora biloba]